MYHNDFQQGLQQYEYRPDPATMEKREIFKASIGIALAVVGMYIVQIASAFVIGLLNLFYLFDLTNPINEQIFYIIIYICGMFLPFFVLSIIYRNKFGTTLKTMIGTSTPRFSSFLLMIFIGLAACMLGNYATGLLQQIMSIFNISFRQPDMAPPEGLVAQIIYLFHITVLPAFFEEFAYRGVILSRLRRFGDGFAILISAILFGVMHGNLVQAPFAFILGLVFGYFYVLTGSIWVGAVIHFLNNLISGLQFFLTRNLTEEASNLVNITIYFLILLFGVISLIFLLKKYPLTFSLTDSNGILSFKKRVLAALPGLIITIASIAVIIEIVIYRLLR